MKRSLIILSAAMAIFSVSSCGGKDDKNKTKDDKPSSGIKGPLDGVWIIKRVEGVSPSIDSMNLETVYTFNGDSLMLSQGSFKNPGLTKTTDSTFSFQAIGTNVNIGYRYKIIGDTLVAGLTEGEQRFYLVKQSQ